MQVTEVATEGLVRQYRVVVPATEIESRINTRLLDLKNRVRIPGFRPGKVPLTLLKKQYGRSVLGEVVEAAVDEGTKEAIGKNELKPALRPKIEITAFDEGKDLEFDMKVEVLPEIPVIDLEAFTLTRLVPEIPESEVDDAVVNFIKRRQQFKAPETPRPAQSGDRLAVGFKGTIDGEAFEGSDAEDVRIVLGSGQMIPGFEDQLLGVEKGATKTVEVTFPESYPPKPELQSKAAKFEVTVKDIEAPEPLPEVEAFAKELGLDDEAAFRDMIRGSMTSRYNDIARQRLKRQLLDQMAERYVFNVPPGMVDMEFDGIWNQLQEEMKRTGQTFEAEGQTEEQTRAEYRSIAERRVRLGLILAEIGKQHEVKVENQELQQALMTEVRRFPGQEKEVFELYRKNPQAMQGLSAPIFEDKVVDLIAAKAAVTEQKIDIESLVKEDEEAEAGPTEKPAESPSS